MNTEHTGTQKTIKRFIESKASHITINFFAWAIFLVLPILFLRMPQHSIIDTIILILIMMGVYYTNSLFLFPRYLMKGKILRFITGIAVLLSVSFLVIFVYFTQFDFDRPGPIFYNKENIQTADRILEKIQSSKNPSREIILKEMFAFKERRLISKPIRMVFLLVLILIISSAIKITQEWLRNEKLRKENDNERLNAELKFLKSQVNPHFLFNTLNSIYSLAYKRSDKTPDAIAKLSNILRYMLYETDIKTVPLDSEFQYLTDYIELQKLRLYDNISIKFETKGDFSKVQIAPMLLVPFVENAFKHGVDNSSECFINIYLEVNHADLFFKVENSIPSGISTEKGIASGIGLQNVKRRLKLLYPDNHLLLIDKNVNEYCIKLNIRLAEYELYNS